MYRRCNFICPQAFMVWCATNVITWSWMKYYFFSSFLSLLLSVDDFYASSVRQTFEKKNTKTNYENVMNMVQLVSKRGMVVATIEVSFLVINVFLCFKVMAVLKGVDLIRPRLHLEILPHVVIKVWWTWGTVWRRRFNSRGSLAPIIILNWNANSIDIFLIIRLTACLTVKGCISVQNYNRCQISSIFAVIWNVINELEN